MKLSLLHSHSVSGCGQKKTHRRTEEALILTLIKNGGSVLHTKINKDAQCVTAQEIERQPRPRVLLTVKSEPLSLEMSVVIYKQVWKGWSELNGPKSLNRSTTKNRWGFLLSLVSVDWQQWTEQIWRRPIQREVGEEGGMRERRVKEILSEWGQVSNVTRWKEVKHDRGPKFLLYVMYSYCARIICLQVRGCMITSYQRTDVTIPASEMPPIKCVKLFSPRLFSFPVICFLLHSTKSAVALYWQELATGNHCY